MLRYFIRSEGKLVQGKYNIIAVNRDIAAILWKDGRYFVIGGKHPRKPKQIDDMEAVSIVINGCFVRPEPIPIEGISEWQDKAREVHIPLHLPKRRAFRQTS